MGKSDPQIGAEIEAGSFQWDPGLEDVHMNIEAALTKKVPAGAKLHTGRSRNDQVATDTRLYLRDAVGAIDTRLESFQSTLLVLARQHLEVNPTILPGYTHLQHAQPVLLSHHLLAYFWMFARDRERLADARGRINMLPLGAAALAGTGL